MKESVAIMLRISSKELEGDLITSTIAFSVLEKRRNEFSIQIQSNWYKKKYYLSIVTEVRHNCLLKFTLSVEIGVTAILETVGPGLLYVCAVRSIISPTRNQKVSDRTKHRQTTNTTNTTNRSMTLCFADDKAITLLQYCIILPLCYLLYQVLLLSFDLPIANASKRRTMFGWINDCKLQSFRFRFRFCFVLSGEPFWR